MSDSLCILNQVLHSFHYFFMGWPKKSFQDLETGLFIEMILKLRFLRSPSYWWATKWTWSGVARSHTKVSCTHREKRKGDKERMHQCRLASKNPIKILYVIQQCFFCHPSDSTVSEHCNKKWTKRSSLWKITLQKRKNSHVDTGTFIPPLTRFLYILLCGKSVPV